MEQFKTYYITIASDNPAKIDHLRAITQEDKELTIRHNLCGPSPNINRSFSAALAAMKAGKGARMPFWPDDMVVRAAFPNEGDGDLMTAPYLYMTNNKGRMPYEPQALALFAEDWEIVD